MKRLAKDIWHIITQNGKWLLLFELAYRGIAVPMYLQLVNGGLHLALDAAGYSYLTAGNVGKFFIQPGTILFLLVTAIVGIALLTLEIAGLLTAFQGSAYCRKLTPFHILWGGMQKMAELVKKRMWQMGIVLLFQYILANAWFLGRAMGHVKPVNFVIHEITKRPMAIFLIIAGLIFMILVVVRCMFVSCAAMMEGKNFPDSSRRSQDVMKGRTGKILCLVFLGNLLVAFVIMAIYVLTVFAAAVFVILFTEQNLAMAVLLSVTDRLEFGLLFLGSILAVVVNFAVLSALYYQYENPSAYRESLDFSCLEKGTPSRRKMAAVLCIIVGVSLFYIFDQVKNSSALSDEILIETQIMAHRGSSRTAPENTISAVEAAIEELADSTELDVQITLDGVVVLGHDTTLKRVAGINRSIGSLTYDEIRELDVGSWFSPSYAGEQIPTLEEVLQLCRGRLGLNIELKNLGKDSPLPDKVVELILQQGMEGQCVITSTSLVYLKRVKELEPRLRTGYIISAAYGDFYSNEAVDFISIRSGFVDERLMENVHGQGKAVLAWTVNSKSEMERLVLLGVDGIITDRPVLAREIIYRKEATESLFEYLRLILR